MQARKERAAPRLVGSMLVNEMLGLAGSTRISQEPLADILDTIGIEVAGSDGNGHFRWPGGAVERELDRIKEAVKAWRAEQAAAARPTGSTQRHSRPVSVSATYSADPSGERPTPLGKGSGKTTSRMPEPSGSA